MTSILIVVPTLNSYQLLQGLVESLKNQSSSDWRVLFVDGPSNTTHRKWIESLCNQDCRFRWEAQLDPNSGIYGAMNQGFSAANPKQDWLLFWGSDDRAACTTVLERALMKLRQLEAKATVPDLYICEGQYFTEKTDETYKQKRELLRLSKFKWRKTFRESLFWGSTPPHQATFIGPGARRQISRYSSDLKIAADLDYFLRLSNSTEIRVKTDDFVLVHMGSSGISGKENRTRLNEVMICYKNAFGRSWWVPFMLRYAYRIKSVIRS